jgi:hypothetical protein
MRTLSLRICGRTAPMMTAHEYLFAIGALTAFTLLSLIAARAFF